MPSPMRPTPHVEPPPATPLNESQRQSASGVVRRVVRSMGIGGLVGIGVGLVLVTPCIFCLLRRRSQAKAQRGEARYLAAQEDALRNKSTKAARRPISLDSLSEEPKASPGLESRGDGESPFQRRSSALETPNDDSEEPTQRRILRWVEGHEPESLGDEDLSSINDSDADSLAPPPSMPTEAPLSEEMSSASDSGWPRNTRQVSVSLNQPRMLSAELGVHSPENSPHVDRMISHNRRKRLSTVSTRRKSQFSSVAEERPQDLSSISDSGRPREIGSASDLWRPRTISSASDAEERPQDLSSVSDAGRPREMLGSASDPWRPRAISSASDDDDAGMSI